MSRKRYGPIDWLVVVVEAFLISMAFLYLSEYFGWNWHTEAGGALVRLVAPPM